LRGEHPDGVLYTGEYTQAGWETWSVRGRRFQVSVHPVDRWSLLPVQKVQLLEHFIIIQGPDRYEQ